MQCIRDNSEAVIPPPIAWGLAVALGVILDGLRPTPLMGAAAALPWVGGVVFAAGLTLAIWARAALGKAETPVETYRPTTRIVMSGPYRWSRNPIYLAMLLGQTGLGIGLNSLWLLSSLAPFFLVIRYGVIAREEAYLERKFGTDYLAYKARVRRWL
jgi:protein-S-isoprenylcysteine O-methyltransferase Ste14